MITAWRLVKQKWADTAFTGEGARLYGGRWNCPGHPLVYTAESLALAELEILVNLPTDRLLGSYVAFRVEILPGLIEVLSREHLPPDWRADPAPYAAQEVGDAWFQSGRSLSLEVPSAVVPVERNYLINPAHEHFEQLRIEGPINPEIDSRVN